MKISEVILALAELWKEVGDMDVEVFDVGSGRSGVADSIVASIDHVNNDYPSALLTFNGKEGKSYEETAFPPPGNGGEW